MNTQKNNVHTLIAGSLLLSPDRKQALLNALPTLDKKNLSALQELLLSEPERINAAWTLVLKKAVQEGNMEWLKTFDDYLQESLRELRKIHEKTSTEDDAEHIEHFFDQTP